MRGGEKNWEWVKKGVPLRVEVGPRDVEAQQVMLSRRDESPQQKMALSCSALSEKVVSLLSEIQHNLYQRVLAFREAHTRRDITTFEELKAFFTPKNEDKPEIHGGFVVAKWCQDPETEKLLDELKVTIRCLPFNQSNTEGVCVLTGRKATVDAVFAKSY